MSRDLKQALQSLQGFNSISASSLEALSRFAAIRVVRAGETIFCQGEPSPYFCGVLEGEVTIQRASRDHRFPKKVIGVIGPGGLFGESSIFEESPRLALASASKNGELLLIKAADFRQWVSQHPVEAQPLLMSLLQTTTNRLHRTSHELSVVYGIGRIFGSRDSFKDQLVAAMEFLKGSLDGVDDIIVYGRSPYWDEFECLMSLPVKEELPSVPSDNEILYKVHTTHHPIVLEPQTFQMPLKAFQLGWEQCARVAVIPLLDWENAAKPLQGCILLASNKKADAFSPEKQLLLASLAQPFAEALARYRRIEEAQAQSRLKQSRQTF